MTIRDPNTGQPVYTIGHFRRLAERMAEQAPPISSPDSEPAGPVETGMQGLSPEQQVARLRLAAQAGFQPELFPNTDVPENITRERRVGPGGILTEVITIGKKAVSVPIAEDGHSRQVQGGLDRLERGDSRYASSMRSRRRSK